MNVEGTVNKVHSLIDKVYQPTNLEMAWNKVRANKGSGGIDRIEVKDFEKVAEDELKILHSQLKEGTYKPMPVRRKFIPKWGKPGEKRPLGIPAIRDRIVQQALKNRLEPVFELEFSESSFGYRPNRSPHDAMKKIYLEIMAGNEWVLDADLRDFFGNVQHERLIDMVAEKVSDGRVLQLIRQMLQAGYVEEGKKYDTSQGTPQGGVISPLLSNIYLNQFDHHMTSKGYRLTRFADDWVVMCKTRNEAVKALNEAKQILEQLGLTLHPEKTKITHIKHGFHFLGYTLRQGKGLKLPKHKIKKKLNQMNVYVIPTEKSVKRFMDTIRNRTKRRRPLKIKELIDSINPVIRGWGTYYRKAHIRKLFNRLQSWIIRRIYSHQCKKWRNVAWKKYPAEKLYNELKLVHLLTLIPDLNLKTASKG